MDARLPRLLPQYLFLIVANALPVYGAFIGKIVFFQVLWIYWVESLIGVGFDLVRIASARGSGAEGNIDKYLAQALLATGNDGPWTLGTRLGIMLSTFLVRVFLLLFYLIFLVLFVGFQVTDDSHIMDVGRSIAFQDPFVNTALIVFIVNGFVQLIGGFFANGVYRTVSPRMYTNLFSARTIIMHVMIGTSVFIHLYLFKDKSYAWLGEAVYVGIFMIVRTVMDLRHLRSEEARAPEPVDMI